MSWELKPITPTRVFNPALIWDEIVSELEELVDDIESDFEDTTTTWDEDVDWDTEVHRIPTGLRGAVETNNQVYAWVDQGTDGPYPIPKVPKTEGSLAFQSSYTPKSIPGVIGSFPGGGSGEIVFAKQVMHPGIKARNFSDVIADDYDRTIAKRFNDAIERGIWATGYAI